ncbi:MAG: spore coat protein CotJB [Paenibacillus dendritiformis]|uniref:spore coat protein CotJB n=1 Tax=Paenibacillus dendritiformis TaxID=130049 RepID=UPI001B27EADA|nr:spore coat protein CotJB [Paenibacillus dendritiformis]MDU5142224.1 spore coat protein CotJB [Paenibacillus dendritiformis]GIO74203.1 spore coat protein CotJB [Paenibacillus dendritiformis]
MSTHGTHPFCTREYYDSLLQLQEIDFVLIELNLYLDTHPEDNQAIQQFNHYVHERMKVARQFQEKFGPLQAAGFYSKCPWSWIDTPWPWQV